MEKAQIAIMKEAGVPEEVRAKIEENGWTKVRLFSKMFSSDSEAKQQGPERLGFKERPDQDVVAACIAMAWEDAQAAAKTGRCNGGVCLALVRWGAADQEGVVQRDG